LSELQHESPDRRVEWTVEPGLQLLGDRNLIRVMLSNLLENAWKYTEKNAGAQISLSRLGGAFCVRDNGAGFDMAYQDKLFQPFQRLHKPGEFEGTGVGLATVQRVVRRHGGKIWAESEVGKGAAFTFEMPEENR
jgi:signal transduction histidine kinase